MTSLSSEELLIGLFEIGVEEDTHVLKMRVEVRVKEWLTSYLSNNRFKWTFDVDRSEGGRATLFHDF